MVDVGVKSAEAWLCQPEGRQLADLVLAVDVSGKDEGELTETFWGNPVLLEQVDEGSPCILTLTCSPASPATISHLMLVSEARTMEVYLQTGEYCGTVRGQRRDDVQHPDRGPFYRKQLTLEEPASSCEVKLLSLGGRGSLMLCGLVVGLRPLQPHPPGTSSDGAVNLQRVQSLVEGMGTTLSPGAQNLMDMVRVQHKNQTSSLDAFWPLLMGRGFLSTLAGEGHTPQPPQNPSGPLPEDSAHPDGPQRQLTEGSEPGAPLAEMMSHFLKGWEHGQVPSPAPELLPVLQKVCGQVTQLRLDDVTAAKERMTQNGTRELERAMERRLEEMERRLKEHMDRRLDALEQKLEKALLGALQQGTPGGPAAGVPELTVHRS
ncbi:ATPase PAAT isoform X2 [Dunckerocampus dactyliophorus]|nr:ATPase PAAT isoform X2 [Dunckerocampus dactyliophorus]XP_054622723.1 ATPase PAAT isoform X2 [Dunckerocampus dactyliophorus]XP_054622724.1 ATPase PAAT isoform X2 [Dunckerocampus dactyliophorus]XP_054622725.1 ATPase PAAT isoform X2 [Dunckerocampus dactyliophorus]